jgi:phytanoyl-CoA hydroxylase
MTPAAVAPRTLSADQLLAFQRDGFLVVPQLADQARIEAVRAAFGEHDLRLLAELAREGLVSADYAHLPFERRFALAGSHAARFGRGWRKAVASPAVFDLHHDPGVLDVIEDLLGGDGIMGHRVFNARPKLPNQELTVVPWHQDSGYFGAESEHQAIITAWIPLVDTDVENGCMQVARGSHGPLMPHACEKGEGQFLEIVGRQPDPATVVDAPMRRGDVLFFGNLLWHRSLPNRSDHVRWSIDLRFYGESLPGRAGGDEGPKWVLRSRTQAAAACAEWLGWMQDSQW